MNNQVKKNCFRTIVSRHDTNKYTLTMVLPNLPIVNRITKIVILKKHQC